MSSILLGPGDRHAAPDVHGADAVPVNPEGRGYRYCLVMPGGEDYLYADGYPDMLEALMPGYSTGDQVDQAERRLRYAETVAVRAQAAILAETDPDTVSDTDWAVLTAPKTGPGAARADWWACEVPLVVVETSYAPWTDLPRPASNRDGVTATNLLWIRPAEAEDLILSLHELGVVRLFANVDLDPTLEP